MTSFSKYKGKTKNDNESLCKDAIVQSKVTKAQVLKSKIKNKTERK